MYLHLQDTQHLGQCVYIDREILLTLTIVHYICQDLLMLHDYITIMKKTFDVMKKLVLDKRSHDQSIQQIRQIRTFPRNHTFAVGNLVYLFAPSAASLQTRSKMFKEDWIRPFQVKAVSDKLHYLLADWYGKLLPFFGAVHIQRLKLCYPNLGKVQNKVLVTVSNIQELKSESEAFEPP